MVVALKKKVWTDEEFMSLSADAAYEVVDGEPIMANSGMEHGNIGAFLAGSLSFHVRKHKLGVVCDSSTGFRMKEGNIRSPDVSFVSRSRLQGWQRPPRGLFEGCPDLVIEILSPNDTVEAIHSKIVEYFDNQARLLWVVHPDAQYVLIYHTPQPDRILRGDDILDGEQIVPEFALKVSELFESLDF